MLRSNCCDAPMWEEENDICSACNEHADFYEFDGSISVDQYDGGYEDLQLLDKENESNHYIDKD